MFLLPFVCCYRSFVVTDVCFWYRGTMPKRNIDKKDDDGSCVIKKANKDNDFDGNNNSNTEGNFINNNIIVF